MKYLPRPGFVLLAFHLLLGFGFMVWFSAMVGLAPVTRLGLLAFHLAINATLWLFFLSATGVLLGIPLVGRWPALSFAIRLVPGVALTLNIFLWVVDVIYFQQAQLNISFKLAAGALRHIGPYSDRLAPPSVWWTLALSFGASCGLYAWMAGPGLRDWTAISAGGWPIGRRLSRFTKRLAAVLLILSCGGAAYGFTTVWRNGEGSLLMQKMLPWYVWRREPLFSFVMLSLVSDGHHGYFPETSRRRRMAQQDAGEREHYGRHSALKRNVILIVVDCLRADHLSLYGYPRETTPFLARLQAEGRLREVKEARSACNCSQGGILSTLSSRDFADLGPGMFQIHDVLRSQGYKIYFILSGQHSSYMNLRTLYGPNQDLYFDGDMASRFYRTDDRLLFEGLDRVPAQDPDRPQPAFFYFHLMSAHDMGVRLPEYSPFQPAPLDIWNSLFGAAPNLSVNAYDNGVRQADAVIEGLFAELARKHYLENSLVLILGDHGQGLGEHNAWHHANGKPLYEQVLRIPLLIVDSADAPYRNLEFALQLDVAPTILDRLSLPVPQTWRGHSLLEPDQRRVSFHHDTTEEGGVAVVLRQGGEEWKYLRSGLPEHEAEALYELRGDPGEGKNRINEPEVAGLLKRLRDLAASQP